MTDTQDSPEPPDGYRLLRRIGRGGFGEVWEATAPGGFACALKFVELGGRAGDAELRALDVMRRVRHPHLLPLLGAWIVGGRLVVAMELGDKTLEDRLAEFGGRGIPLGEVLVYLQQSAAALDHLRNAGDGETRRHRDVKPSNILLVGGVAKIADFGLSRIVSAARAEHSGSLTPLYAPPEFFRGESADASDQYSLAVTYCRLRGGRTPFAGEVAALVAGHLHGRPDLSMLPEDERPAVARALAKDPSARWPSCADFAAALGSGVPAEFVAPTEEYRPARPGRRRLRATVAGSIAVMLGSALLLFVTIFGVFRARGALNIPQAIEAEGPAMTEPRAAVVGDSVSSSSGVRINTGGIVVGGGLGLALLAAGVWALRAPEARK